MILLELEVGDLENYIDKVLEQSIYKQEIIRLFYLNPVSDDDLKKYEEESLKRVAQYMLRIIGETPVKEIIDSIESDASDIQEVTTQNIPQYSNLDAVEKLLQIVESNPGCNYELIGYFFNKDGSKGAQTKYGENHYKTAALLNLTTWKQPYSVTFLGKEYMQLEANVQNEIKVKLFLLVPIIQKTIIRAKYENVNMMDILRKYLSESTAVRRRSNVKNMMDYICRSEVGLEIVETNLNWK